MDYLVSFYNSIFKSSELSESISDVSECSEESEEQFYTIHDHIDSEQKSFKIPMKSCTDFEVLKRHIKNNTNHSIEKVIVTTVDYEGDEKRIVTDLNWEEMIRDTKEFYIKEAPQRSLKFYQDGFITGIHDGPKFSLPMNYIPTTSIQESIKKLVSENNAEEIINKSLLKLGDFKDINILEEDKLAILFYTYHLKFDKIENNLYYIVNQICRSKNFEEWGKSYDYIYYLIKALGKLETTSGKCWRGTIQDSTPFKKLDEIFRFEGFLSASLNQKVAQNFTEFGKTDQILLILEGSKIIPLTISHYKEGEVLFPPGSEWKLKTYLDLKPFVCIMEQYEKDSKESYVDPNFLPAYKLEQEKLYQSILKELNNGNLRNCYGDLVKLKTHPFGWMKNLQYWSEGHHHCSISKEQVKKNINELINSFSYIKNQWESMEITSELIFCQIWIKYFFDKKLNNEELEKLKQIATIHSNAAYFLHSVILENPEQRLFWIKHAAIKLKYSISIYDYATNLNSKEALKYHQLAAKDGIPLSWFWLGCYYRMTNIERDNNYELSDFWFEKSKNESVDWNFMEKRKQNIFQNLILKNDYESMLKVYYCKKIGFGCKIESFEILKDYLESIKEIFPDKYQITFEYSMLIFEKYPIDPKIFIEKIQSKTFDITHKAFGNLRLIESRNVCAANFLVKHYISVKMFEHALQSCMKSWNTCITRQRIIKLLSLIQKLTPKNLKTPDISSLFNNSLKSSSSSISSSTISSYSTTPNSSNGSIPSSLSSSYSSKSLTSSTDSISSDNQYSWRNSLQTDLHHEMNEIELLEMAKKYLVFFSDMDGLVIYSSLIIRFHSTHPISVVKEALDNLKNGNAEWHMMVAYCFKNGIGCEKSEEESISFIKSYENHKLTEKFISMIITTRKLKLKQYVPENQIPKEEDLINAVKHLQSFDMKFSTILAYCFENGIGCKQDETTYIKYQKYGDESRYASKQKAFYKTYFPNHTKEDEKLLQNFYNEYKILQLNLKSIEDPFDTDNNNLNKHF